MDKRVKNTIKAIRNALFEMLSEKPLNRISVTELCKRAGVNRATFYLHYTDIYDLLDKIELSYVEEMRENDTRFGTDGKVDFLWIVEFVKRHSTFYRVTFINHIPTRFMDEFYNELEKLYVSSFDNLSEKHLVYMFEFLKSGVTGVITKWIASGMRESSAEIAEILRETFMNMHCLN